MVDYSYYYLYFKRHLSTKEIIMNVGRGRGESYGGKSLM